MSGYVYANAVWGLIPASPLGASATGPVQSIDTRYLWWWNSTKISCFDLQQLKWLGPWSWDGATVNYASQWFNGHVFFGISGGSGAAYRTLTQGGAGKISDWFMYNDSNYISGNIHNTAFAGYLGSGFALLENSGFSYDPKFPDSVVVTASDGYGSGDTVILYMSIEAAIFGRGVVVGEQIIMGAAGSWVIPGGLMGNPSLLFGYYQLAGFKSGGGTEEITLGNLSLSNLLENTPPLVNYSTLTTVVPLARTYAYPNAAWVGGTIYSYPAITNFDAVLMTVPGASPHGGWLGPNSLFLIESVTEKGNPATFLYTETVRNLPNGTGTFKEPFPINGNPIGDNPIEFAGYKNLVFVGAKNNTNWYLLGLSSYQVSKYSLTNYMFQRN